MLRVARRLDASPFAVGAVVAVLAVVLVGARFAVAAEGDISRFVVAGASFTDARSVDPPIHVFPSSGYDGQFYWRMAVAPNDHNLTPSQGVRLDQEIRFGRIGYPLLAWLASAGRAELAIWSLVAVNIVALASIGAFAAAFARDHGHSTFYGLLVSSSAGLVMSLSRDLCEVVMVAGLIGAALAISRKRPLLAALGFSLAVLTHEQSLVIIAGYTAWCCWEIATRQRRPDTTDATWLIPLGVLALWQIVCAVAWGRAPILQSGGKNLDVPFVALARLGLRWVRDGIPAQHVVAPAQLALMAAVVLVAARRSPPRHREAVWQRVALLLAVAMALSISYNVLKSPTDFRTMVIVPTFGWLAILASDAPPPRWLIWGAAVVLVATVAMRVVAI